MADDFDKLEEELLAIPQFKTEYDALEPEHEIICQIQRQKSYVMRKQLVKLLLSLSSTTLFTPLLFIFVDFSGNQEAFYRAVQNTAKNRKRINAW